MQRLCYIRSCSIFSNVVLLALAAAILSSASRLATAEEVPTSDATGVDTIDVDAIFAGEVPESVDELRAMQARIQELSEKVIPSTVGLRVGGSQGSGVIVSADGYVLTAAHVIGRSGRRITLILQDGTTISGRSLGLCQRLDSGLAKITDDPPEGGWPFVEMGNSEWMDQGQWVLSTGHPGGYERGRRPVVRVGRVLSTRPTVLRSDCTLVGGDSGGPLFDMEGRVVGIHSRIGGSLSANMHVPIDLFVDTWNRMDQGETWGEHDDDSPFMGVVGPDDVRGPAEVVDVVKDSPAEDAGLRNGDIILQLNDIEITSLMRLMSASSGLSPDEEVVLSVQRGDETITIDITVGSR